MGIVQNAIRLSVGLSTTTAEVEIVMPNLKQAVAKLDGLGEG